MTALRNSISRSFLRWTSSFQERRRRKVGERIMNDLSPRLQRDIGWEPVGPVRRR